MFCKICGKILRGVGNERICCGLLQNIEDVSFTVNYSSCPKCGSLDIIESVTREYLEEIVQTFTTRECVIWKCKSCGHRW